MFYRQTVIIDFVFIKLLCIVVHLCAEQIAASMMSEPLGEVHANISLQLSSRTKLIKSYRRKSK